MQNLEQLSVARQDATKLFDQALQSHMWGLANDIARFLRAIGRCRPRFEIGTFSLIIVCEKSMIVDIMMSRLLDRFSNDVTYIASENVAHRYCSCLHFSNNTWLQF